ncbi:MAG: SDR family oxidoreductase [Thermaceae bacterium]|nr:SDR family oxidoreductase [Thermaceae bacterium]
MQIRFDHKTVLVTGAAHGFGRAIAHRFARLGASVWAWDLNAEELQETRAQAEGHCEVRRVDVTDPQAVQEAAQEAGAVDVLVNNAGGVLGQVGKPLETVTPKEWNDILAVNLSAAFYTSQAVAPGMKQRRWGRIINISSGAGLGPSLTGIQAYASAKAGLVNLTRQLCHELGPFNITVNCIAPGFVRSNPTTERQWQSYGEEGQRRLLENIALKRLGTAQNIADGVLFFASELADWVSGQVLSVDGGK